MKIPKVTQLPSGNWHCYLRIGGQQISVTEATKERCEAKAMAYKTGLMEVKRHPERKTLSELIDEYLADRYNVLSPSTIRGYRTIQRNRFPSVMHKPLSSVRSWQRVIDDEARRYAPKTVINAWGMVRAVLAEYIDVPRVKLPQKIKSEPKYLRPEQIPAFIREISKTNVAVPALLALSSLRLSEIKALTWEDIPPSAKVIRVSGSVVPDEHNQPVHRRQNKTVSSARTVPILIPALRDMIKNNRGEGSVLTVHETMLRRTINAVCRSIGADEVSVHGLRHSFASLGYHLGVPPKVMMEIGGWSNESTMHGIYTHVAESDLVKYASSIEKFMKNADKNAHKNL